SLGKKIFMIELKSIIKLFIGLNNASQKSHFEPKRGSGQYYQIVTKYRVAGISSFRRAGTKPSL
ncbi:MAG: hypothetical protein RL170_772, partial [Bacteroidota bacterium]